MRPASPAEPAVADAGLRLHKPSGPALNMLRLLALLAVAALSVYIFSIRVEASRFAAYGYPGIFLVSVLSNATLLLPAPGVAIVFAMGGIFNPLLVAIAAGAGASIGEIVGYVAGFSGQPVIGRIALYDRITAWMRKYGALTVLILALIPNPLFDLAGMAAGALKMPFGRFFIWCLIGKLIKMLIFAYGGAYSIGWLAGYIH